MKRSFMLVMTQDVGTTPSSILEEKASYASEHWKDAHLPCSHPDSCGAFSRRLERLPPLQSSVVSPCPLSRCCLFGDDNDPLIRRTLVALATLARSGHTSNCCCSDPHRLLGPFLSGSIRSR